MACSTVITFLSGIGIEAVNERYADIDRQTGAKKLIVAVSFLSNLGILAFFKYGNFILENISLLTGRPMQMPFDVILPVGISFYTFQALSYTMDVYQGKIKAEKNIIYYAVFVSFFPQLVAGPIERSGNLLGQVRTRHYFNAEEFLCGFWMMLFGFFEKIVIADRVAVYVDTVFSDYTAVGGIQDMLAILGFTLQIYCDFAGYSHIAIGTARILGVRLMDNFKQPYLATSIQDFWRRWHISLSTWFRDYLYIPLGGNRCGTIRRFWNLLITFLASGLWHGAAWHYVFWGGGHGLYQVIGSIFKPVKRQLALALHINKKAWSHKLLQCLITFFLTAFAWLFFRAESLGQAFAMLRYMLTNRTYLNHAETGLNAPNVVLLLCSICILFLISILREKQFHLMDKLLMQNDWFKVIITAGTVLAILVFGMWGGSYEASSFIYFQF